MDCGLRVLDSGYFVIGTCIPDSKAKDSSIHKYKLSEFWNPDYLHAAVRGANSLPTTKSTTF